MISIYVLPVVLVISILITSVILLKVDLYGAMGMDRDSYEELLEQGNSAEGISDSFQMGFEAGFNATAEQMEAQEAEEEVEREMPSLWGEGMFYYDDVETLFQQQVAGLVTILLMAIFVGIYIGDNYKYKFDKNLVIACKHRGTMTAVRITVIALYTLVLHVVTYLGTILGVALMADSVKFNVDKASVLYFIITYLLTLGFSLVIMLITNACRSKAAGITIGVILASGILTMIVSLATMIAVHYLPLPDDFSFANYFLSQNLGTLSLDSEGSVVLRALLCAIIYSIVCSVGSLLFIKKRDIA